MTANRMWGGRFREGPAAIMEDINASIEIDKRLAMQDLRVSRAHSDMLEARQIISTADARQIAQGLDTIYAEITQGHFVFKPELEDIHLNIESRLLELIGPVAGKLHTARSRNDQVATDFRLWVRHAADDAVTRLFELQKALLAQAERHAGTIMPGFTHMQPAQPITFGHHCLAYVEMFERDRTRFRDARARMNESPLGAVALAGTSFPIDRERTAKTSRDFALEYLAAGTICSTNLSRLAEEIVLWSSPAFGFIRLSDAFTTGSSIMPQKRNPDAAELVRAKTGRILGSFVALSTVMKGVALAYAKDLQEDKQSVFEAADSLDLSLAAAAGMVNDMQIQIEAMREAAGRGFPTATDLADWIVRVLGKPFREAHHIAGAIVKGAEALNLPIQEMPLEEMQKIEPSITRDVYSVLSIEASVSSRRSPGGTSPERVREQIAFWRERLT